MVPDDDPHYPEQPRSEPSVHTPYSMTPPPKPRGRGPLGAILAGIAIAATKAKLLLGVLFSLKYLILLKTFGFSALSMIVTIGIYSALFGGFKIALIFVLMILVHEMGHYITWRNFGVRASLPMFIPGFGAFVSGPGGTPAQNAAASLAGPLYGIAAAAACWAIGYETHDRLLYACAYIGFFLNFFNLIPIPPFDGGAIAGAIDARLWWIGVPLFAVYMFFVGLNAFSIIFLALIAFVAVPRMIALWRGQIDPRASGLTTKQRIATAAAYFGSALLAIGGAAATHLDAVHQ